MRGQPGGLQFPVALFGMGLRCLGSCGACRGFALMVYRERQPWFMTTCTGSVEVWTEEAEETEAVGPSPAKRRTSYSVT